LNRNSRQIKCFVYGSLGLTTSPVVSQFDALNTGYFTLTPQAPGAGSSTASGLTFTNDHITAIPEPETCAMMLAGLGLLGFMARRRKQKEAATIYMFESRSH
jgi:hypothetical protein